MDRASEARLQTRIDRMAWRDRVIALVFITAMWVVLLFVYFVTTTVAPTVSIIIALTVAMLLLGLVNTASILALIKRYSQEKEHVYREDIVNLDLNRGAQVQAKDG